MTSQPSFYVLQPGETVSGADVKASGESTGGQFTLIESHATGGAPLHMHTREDEYFYVLDGTIHVRCGDETCDVDAGGFVFLPRNVPHEWDVVGEKASLLIMTVPAGLDRFLAEFHASPSAEERAQIATEHGIQFL